MDRLTRSFDTDIFYVDDAKVRHDANGYYGDAINKLARFEDIYEDLMASQTQIPEELEKLRNEGKTKSVRFKELMVKKMTNAYIIDLFKIYGL